MKGFDIWVVWVPSHGSVEGNEIAFHLTNIGRSLSFPDNIVINVNYLFPLIRKHIWELWESM